MSQPSPLAPARQRALALAGAGDLGGARALLEQAVELGKINLAEDDPDVLRTAYELGMLLQRSDDPSAARRVLEEAHASGQWRLGDSDPLMLEISHGIGTVAEELGNRHEARKAFARVAELGPSALGSDHWAVAQARAYLGDGQESGQGQEPVFVRDEPAPPALDEPTAPLQVIEPTARPGTVQPPNEDNQQVWRPPVEEPRVWRPALEEPTAAQPVIVPRVEPSPGRELTGAGRGQVVPAQRAAYEDLHVTLQPPVSAEVVSPTPHGDGQGAYKKGLGLFAAIAAVMAAVIAVAALVFVLAKGSHDSGGDSNVPTLSGPPPTEVELRDGGTTIGVSWKDPSGGSVSFIVTMGHPGELLKPAATLGPGTTSYSLGALNPALNYCFTVVAVYRGNKFATSPQQCTSRASATPR